MEIFLVLVGVHKVREIVPQRADTVPLRTGVGVHSFLFCIRVLP